MATGIRNTVVSAHLRENYDRAISCSQMYPHHREMIKDFLKTRETKNVYCNRYGHKKYMVMMQALVNHTRASLDIDVDDIGDYCHEHIDKQTEYAGFAHSLMVGVMQNTQRYVEIFYEEMCQLLDQEIEPDQDATTDSRVQQRYAMCHKYSKMLADETEKAKQKARDNGLDPASVTVTATDFGVPPKLLHPYDVNFRQSIHYENLKMREVRADEVGKLVRFDGIIAKCTQVKPKMEVATYICTVCGAHSFQPIESDEFTPLQDCPSLICKDSKTTGLHDGPNMRRSRFVKYQEVKIQEVS